MFFLAGFETIQVTSSNFVYFMAQHPKFKQKFLDEITPVLDSASDDFVKKLTLNVVEDNFIYTKRCIYETLRLNPPTGGSSNSCFNKSVNLGGVDFFKDDTVFCLNFLAIHHDP